jgi:hypothetical protein
MKQVIIVGSSNIAKIHYNFFFQNNFKKIYFVGRQKKKIFNFIKFNALKKATYKSKSFLQSATDSIISICNHSDFHQEYLDSLCERNNLMIIEKPLISINVFKSNYINKLKSYFKKFNKLVVLYPMKYMVKNLKNIIHNQKFKNIDIYYFTKGNHVFENIFIDLAPHTLIFFREICKLKNVRLGKLIKIKKEINRYNNYINLVYDNININIYLKQNYKGLSSIFFFRINKTKYKRVTKLKNNIFESYINVNKKSFLISNPMNEVFADIIKSNKKKYFFRKNYNDTIWLSKLTLKIYSLSK